MDLPTLHSFEDEIRKQVPGFRVAFKNESWTQRLLGIVMHVFNPAYMTRFVSTFSPVVYFPNREHYESDPDSSFRVLAHEYVHLLDTQAKPFWFRVSYLMPQVLFLPLLVSSLVALAFKPPVVVLILLGFLTGLCLAPWPSSGRTKWEKRGYAMSLATIYWMYNSVPTAVREEIVKCFTRADYYFMSWNSAKIEQWAWAILGRIQSNDLQKEAPYSFVHEFLRVRGLLPRVSEKPNAG